MINVMVSEASIDLAQVNWSELSQPHCGASNTFTGVVRNLNHGRQVSAVSYDAYIPLAEKVLKEIALEAQAKWANNSSIFIQHRIGKLLVGELSVIIVVHTPHRDESFLMCRYVIEELKVRVPIWKKEFYIDGETEWLKGHELCSHT
jgi:molybdopterin synthase catalytic subunit